MSARVAEPRARSFLTRFSMADDILVTAEESGFVCRGCGAPLQDDEALGGRCLACRPDAAFHQEEFPASVAPFEHYRLATRDDGTLLELGRGAMGITYKAFDVNLHCPVALKVINEKYLGDELARRRLSREARAAASIRHPNVASVFHLGRTNENYFYAMEFVEGETLESLIKRSGRLDVRFSLEIAQQVSAGLAAVHKKKLVHRDIKPSNIMVVKDASPPVAKIIDLGLAKGIDDPGNQSAISMAGAFVGTPEFASPEQIAGVEVDIRSDLYSLGVMFWEMVTGRAPFRGSPFEVMHKHQHAPLPLEQLEDLPQPVVALVATLLEKDPGRRFQAPAELLKAIPAIKSAIDAGRTITYQTLQRFASAELFVATRNLPARPRPEKISVARLPITGSDIFGREEDIAFLNDAWASPDVNVATIVAWAGVGKSTLVNHWLRGMAAEDYRSAELVFGWSFYREGTSGDSSSADEFLDAALTWFGDSDPRVGTAWEKGERLANLVAHRRTLLILDGLEPLQHPPGPQEGRLREPGLQALLRELAAFNTGLCVATTRMPVADTADYERTSAPRRELENLSNETGAKLLRALGVKGREAELRSASDEFSGHCLALTLLGGYLTDAYSGDINCRREVSERLAHDVRQGVHARKVMESYQIWFGEGPELSVLRMLGLFDRPADEKVLQVLLNAPAVPGVTESLADLNPTEWRKILARLRRAGLLAGEDPDNPGQLDTHPLVREYFGEQLRSRRTEAWKECNRRLFDYYRKLAPEVPDSFRKMEPLFLAVICGCNAGLFRQALREVYGPRIQRGKASFAANVLGARGALLSVLAHFFEQGRWGSLVESGVEDQSLTMEDRLFVLMQAALNLTATRGMAAPEARDCYAQAESLCHALNRPQLLYLTLMGQWRYSFMTDKLSVALSIAKRTYSLAQEQNDGAPMIGGYCALANTLYYSGDFESARQHAARGVQIWRLRGLQSQVEEVTTPAVICLCIEAHAQWHLGEITSSKATMAEAITLAKELNHSHTLATTLFLAAILGHFERDPLRVESLASELIELSTRQSFAQWLAGGKLSRGWVRSVYGHTAEGISWIEEGIQDYRANGSMLGLTYFLAVKAEALHLAHRTSEALEALREAEALAERSEERAWCAEMRRLRGVFLVALGADESQIEASFCEAISTAKQQKSASLATRAEATYADYRHRRGDGVWFAPSRAFAAAAR
jgi:predicted ATPase